MQLGAFLDYKLGLNSRHYLSRKWAWHFVFAPYPHLDFKRLTNFKYILLKLFESPHESAQTKNFQFQVRKWHQNDMQRPLPAQVVTQIWSQFVVQDSLKVRAKFQT
jgi:hypothetical protein